MSLRYQIVEPHPTATTYMHTARGGFGNIAKTPNTVTSGPNATGPASLTTSIHPRRAFTSGRGGAGNIQRNRLTSSTPAEHTIFSFDEELERELRHEHDIAPIYHVGRGGAGNICSNNEASSSGKRSTSDSHGPVPIDGSTWRKTKDAETDSAKSSASSTESGADIATRNIRRGLQKGWGKVVGSWLP